MLLESLHVSKRSPFIHGTQYEQWTTYFLCTPQSTKFTWLPHPECNTRWRNVTERYCKYNIWVSMGSALGPCNLDIGERKSPPETHQWGSAAPGATLSLCKVTSIRTKLSLHLNIDVASMQYVLFSQPSKDYIMWGRPVLVSLMLAKFMRLL